MKMSRKHAIEVLERSNALLKLQLAKLSDALDEVEDEEGEMVYRTVLEEYEAVKAGIAALKGINVLPVTTGWISDHKPPEGKPVQVTYLTYAGNFPCSEMIAIWYKGQWRSFATNAVLNVEVTHWRPLAAPAENA